MQISHSKHSFFTGNMTSCLHRKLPPTGWRPQSRMSLGTAGSDSRLLQYHKSMNGKGNVFQQGTICWFGLHGGSSHWGTERGYMAGDAWTGRQRGSSQGQNWKARWISQWKTGSGGRARTHEHSHTLNHSIIACLVVCMNTTRECALAGSALKSALS